MVDSINSLGSTQNSKLTRLDGGVTKRDNGFGIFKDSKGNSVYRVDYQNNNQVGIYDEEEVRRPDGTLISYSQRSYQKNGEIMYVEKHVFDENGREIKVIETKCDRNGKTLETKECAPSHSALVGTVSMGRSVDGENGDSELIKTLAKWGAHIIGRN